MGGILERWVVVRLGTCAAVFLAWLLSGCATKSDAFDLAENERLFLPPAFVATVSADRPLFVGPVVDARTPVTIVEASGPYPTYWMPDSTWDRPLGPMLHDCLTESLRRSKVASRVDVQAPPAREAVLLEVSLVEGRAGQEEREFGRRSLASIGLRVVVRGPADADGTRAVLLEETFEQTVGTEVEPRPLRVPAVFGLALRQVLTRVVARLDAGNFTRTGLTDQGVR
ncbi:MAG: hypothetical protein RL562_1121 [Planctomycetota bacterium]